MPRPAIAAAKLAAAATFLLLPASLCEAKNQFLDWKPGMEDAMGGKVEILQCQALTFKWDAGEGFTHSVWEFFNEEAYETCNFSRAWNRGVEKQADTFVYSYEDTLPVTKRWFGSEVGTDCERGMKIAVKVRPLFVNKYEGSECAGGKVDIEKNKGSIKACRKQCKQRRGCVGIQYNPSLAKNCRLYRSAPESSAGTPNANAQCEVAATTCAGQDNIPAPAPTAAPVCDMDLTVRCEVCVQGQGEGCRGTDCNYWGDSGQNRKIRYKYTFTNKGDGAIFVHSLKRFRPNDTFGTGDETQLGGSNYLLPKGTQQFVGETGPFDFGQNGAVQTVFRAEVSCDTQGNGPKQTFEAKYDLNY